MDNMELWNKVCNTNPNDTKNYKGKGGFNGTAVCAQTQRKRATEQFGVFGIGWGIEREDFSVMEIGSDVHNFLLCYKANLYFTFDKKRGSIPLASEIPLFNAGKEYRLLVCNQEQIGNVQFKVLDQSRNELYSSNPDEANSYWDFKVENTQSLIIQLSVPDIDKRNQITKLTPNGCVALLVGFKE